jgi:CheY-like chemotaxis protein
VNKLPTWVLSDLSRLRNELAAALEKDLNESNEMESQVECRLEDGTVLVFISRDPHYPRDNAKSKELLHFRIEPASNRETFKGLLSQARGSANLGNIKTLLRGLSFLLVDDSLDNLDVQCALISDLGGEADSAQNGEEAIRKAMSGNYDLVLMDIQMPVMDGNQAMKQLLDLGFKAPVIAVSAVSSRAEREASFKCGFKDYLTKPFDPDQLIRTILRLTKRPIPIASKSGTVHSVHA